VHKIKQLESQINESLAPAIHRTHGLHGTESNQVHKIKQLESQINESLAPVPE
jgi:hypothetical protein